MTRDVLMDALELRRCAGQASPVEPGAAREMAASASEFYIPPPPPRSPQIFRDILRE
jgi:hypothetical protein